MTIIIHILIWVEDKSESTKAGCQKTGTMLFLSTGLQSSLVNSDLPPTPSSPSLADALAEYHLCQSGTHQSPINIVEKELSQHHKPTFEGYAKDITIPGNFFNWEFAPAWTPHHPEGVVTALPSMKFDDQEVYMIGWHIHAPSEHLIAGKRSRAEIHLVHVTEEEHEAAVIGIRVAVGDRESAFFKQLGPMIHYNDTAQLEGLPVNMRLAIDEVGGVEEFWTYKGSLTTPPCSEGLRWFLPKQELIVSEQQMVEILAASRFSHRVEQQVWLHDVNL
ncbi:uncharacterized protein Z519_00055 [Cladophialophora bantiana CBS 173.52]|uniref:Alpha-carbonic anhydrase domain-containing protein n=1 Tax=Cladophialophora bantiana (strain ATCC 10958 / CBS 173.52 / CDC B-1940 / NIH 8579) TaxID=1442370 RepID=A0A0D2I540_CLAB1|nr:uncharacterized protein Z519_00055 [Cladophialophora bantiana CBS 173.52]KIW98395.1 hypothetical protein Z519_00055 [Cladophialophora bantiana CBS 173.52]